VYGIWLALICLISPDPDTHPKYALNHRLLGEKPLTKMGLKNSDLQPILWFNEKFKSSMKFFKISLFRLVATNQRFDPDTH
jgi:hypothetical protein